jgi:putative oxidoreductase
MNADLGLLVLRVPTGALMAAHGAQKLFGSFEGPGLKGFESMVESMGMQPGRYWALAGATAEFAGGTLTALGLFYPLGPISILSSMSIATAKVHWGKPIWAHTGGAEVPVLYSSAAAALWITGPGRFSLDHLFGIKLPRWIVAATALTAGASIGYGIRSKPAPSGLGLDDTQPSSGTTQEDNTQQTEPRPSQRSEDATG